MSESPRVLPDATSILQTIARGEQTAEQVVERHLARLHQWQPRINAATTVFDQEAIAQARNPRPGPLCGLPVSIKETVGLAGHPITAGSMRMPPLIPARDAIAVARLRSAGAIVIARSNVPEFAMAGETDNPRFGCSNNPLDLDRTCGGSSGGEGALVASGCVAAGLGSDILGSIRIPASFCGVVGFKPGSGAIPKRDSWPDLSGFFTDSWLALGPIARSVRDVRLLYQVLSEQVLPAPAPIAGCRLLMPEGFPLRCRDPVIGEAMTAASDGLAAAGMKADRRKLGDVPAWYRHMSRYLAWELAPLLKSGLTTADGSEFSLLRESLARLRGGGEIYAGLYRLLMVGPLLRYRRASSAAGARLLLETARVHVRQRLDADGILLLPTIGVLAPAHGDMNRLSLRPGVNGLMTPLTLCNYLDLPAITVPAWRHRDPATSLVPGIMLASAPGAEGLLLDVAMVLESIIGLRPAQCPGAAPGTAADGVSKNDPDSRPGTQAYGD
ncbi:MAG: amidase [Gammaproteobacteria bacterium]